VIHCLLIFLSVAFFILFERKIISLFHNRIGPNKVSFIGFVQTLLDAFKFFLKQNILPLTSNFILFSIAPLIGLLIACLI
jgi:NADH-quinone oxidoreductase subunit H